MTSTSTAAPSASAQSFDASPGKTSFSGLPQVENASRVAPKDAREMSRIFLDRLQELEEGTPEYQYARNTLIEMNVSLVRFAAARFRNRDEPREDILQVGTIGLIKAIDRFDVSREVEFTTFAIPYITGEIKRFFRDTSWAVHVPRRLQELRIELARTLEQLEARLDRVPTTDELAQAMDLSTEEVIDAKLASNGYVADSLDLPPIDAPAGQGSSALADRVGGSDPAMEYVENLLGLKPLLADLGERDRRILEMRFGEELTQAQIGTELGVSQMQVSRLLTRCLAQLRTGLTQT